MSWSLILTSLVEVAKDEAQGVKKKEGRSLTQKNDENGGVLASKLNQLDDEAPSEVSEEELQKAFNHIWKSVSSWMGQVVRDAVTYASSSEPRNSASIARILRRESPSQVSLHDINAKFARSVWPSLKTRGWTATVETEGNSAGKTKYVYSAKEVSLIIQASET